MTVRELILILQDCDDQAEIIVKGNLDYDTSFDNIPLKNVTSIDNARVIFELDISDNLSDHYDQFKDCE